MRTVPRVYFAKQDVMMLNNRNMQVSILDINRKIITTVLNKLLYPSDSGHGESKHMHVAGKID